VSWGVLYAVSSDSEVKLCHGDIHLVACLSFNQHDISSRIDRVLKKDAKVNLIKVEYDQVFNSDYSEVDIERLKILPLFSSMRSSVCLKSFNAKDKSDNPIAGAGF